MDPVAVARTPNPHPDLPNATSKWTYSKSITQLTLCQVTTDEADAATKLLEKACQKLRGITNVPSQRITDLEAAIRQIRQLSCILDSCTISASYEVRPGAKSHTAYATHSQRRKHVI